MGISIGTVRDMEHHVPIVKFFTVGVRLTRGLSLKWISRDGAHYPDISLHLVFLKIAVSSLVVLSTQKCGLA